MLQLSGNIIKSSPCGQHSFQHILVRVSIFRSEQHHVEFHRLMQSTWHVDLLMLQWWWFTNAREQSLAASKRRKGPHTRAVQQSYEKHRPGCHVCQHWCKHVLNTTELSASSGQEFIDSLLHLKSLMGGQFLHLCLGEVKMLLSRHWQRYKAKSAVKGGPIKGSINILQAPQNAF